MTELDGATRNRRIWLLTALTVIGIVYAVGVSEQVAVHSQALVPLEHQSPSLRLLFGPFLFGLLLAPITVVWSLLGVRPTFGMLAALVFEIVMIIVWYQYTGEPNISVTGLASGDILFSTYFWIFSLALQLPLWGIARLVALGARKLRHRFL